MFAAMRRASSGVSRLIAEQPALNSTLASRKPGGGVRLALSNNPRLYTENAPLAP